MAVFQNNLLMGASSQGGASVHEIGQSILFNDDDSPFMYRTPTGTGNRRTWSINCWVKLCNSPGDFTLWSVHTGYQSYAQIRSDGLEFAVGNGSSSNSYHKTNRVFRDSSAWYNFLFVFDSTNVISSERARIYVNGQRETSFSNTGSWAQNYDSNVNFTQAHYIGEQGTGGNHLDGYLTDFVIIDGLALDPSSFGETNNKGIWVPKDISELTFGTNGVFIDGRNAGQLGNDESSNGNDFSTSGLNSADQSPDTPTNNFTTMNVLDNYPQQGVFSKGNLQIVSAFSQYGSHTSTMGVNKGKWYAELKWTAQGSSPSGYYSNTHWGIVGSVDTPSSIGVGLRADSYCYIGTTVGSGEEGGKKKNNGTATAYGADYHVNDIIGIALDLDNNKIYWSKNGTWQNSGNPESGATGTGSAFDLTTPSSGFYYFAVSDQHGASTSTWQINFGSVPPYTISSGNSDGNGYGNFEYAVPSGYYSVCTKNISEFG